MNLSYTDFLRNMKHISARAYRIPFGTKKGTSGGLVFDASQFNALMKSEKHHSDDRYKRDKNIAIQDGKIGLYDKNGNFSPQSIFKVGEKKDLMIESIDGGFVTLRIGTFSQTEEDQKAKKIKKGPQFHGTGSMTVSLSFLWSYIQSNTYEELTKPKETVTFPPDKAKDTGMSWWNIFKHAHSLGTVLHGDLWK